jgi:hypothetical protein
MPMHHLKSARTALACAVLVLGSTAASAGAQNASSANVTAEVQQPLTVSTSNHLDFGSVFAGTDKTVAVTNASAAAFTVQGEVSANVNLTFTLPATISKGGDALPISNWTARHNTSNSAAAGTDFTPSATATAAALSGTGFLYVFVGATAEPAANQPAGSYTGTATLTVVYF